MKGDTSSLNSLIGESREKVIDKLGWPSDEIYINDRIYLMYGTDFIVTKTASFIHIPVGKSTHVGCLRIELDSNAAVKQHKRKTAPRVSYNYWDCRSVFWDLEQIRFLQQDGDYLYLQSFEPDRAHRWLCKSADSGHSRSRYDLAQIFQYSKQNYIQAYVWYSLSGIVGEEWLLSFVDNHLSQEEHEDAKLALQEWRPGQCESDMGLNENHQ